MEKAKCSMTELIYKEIFAVEVPVLGYDFKIKGGGFLYKSLVRLGYSMPERVSGVFIPIEENATMGSWQLIGISDEMSEAMCSEVVEKSNDGSTTLRSWWYRNYLHHDDWTRSVFESFQSLLKSKKLNGRYCIIKKIK